MRRAIAPPWRSEFRCAVITQGPIPSRGIAAAQAPRIFQLGALLNLRGLRVRRGTPRHTEPCSEPQRLSVNCNRHPEPLAWTQDPRSLALSISAWRIGASTALHRSQFRGRPKHRRSIVGRLIHCKDQLRHILTNGRSRRRWSDIIWQHGSSGTVQRRTKRPNR